MTTEAILKKQRVMVLQQYGTQLIYLSPRRAGQPHTCCQPKPGPEPVLVNGQLTPCVQMNPNEMQFWRIINACHQARCRSIAQPESSGANRSGWGPIQSSKLQSGMTNAALRAGAGQAPFGSLAPGNRIDLLVQARALRASTKSNLAVARFF